MKKIILLSTVVLGLSFSQSFAQTTKTPAQQKKEWAMTEGKQSRDSIIAALNLTPDQKTKLEALVKEGKTKREAIWKNQSLTQDQKKQQMTALREEGRKKLAAILTKEQQQKLQRLHKKAKGTYSRQKNGNGQTTDPSSQILEPSSDQ
jgi:Spy/CpxP family protein refolding chaperone